jgi:hypothetical protein
MTFPISTPFFHGLIDRLLTEEGSVFKMLDYLLLRPRISAFGSTTGRRRCSI